MENDVNILDQVYATMIFISQQDMANFKIALENPMEKVIMSIDFPILKSDL